MKRVVEKVKDIVEVCPFLQLHDFAADPALTLTSYHFTDITSDLMAKWIERIASLDRGVGMGAALAGFRGVGKSHFLAAVASTLSRPELRGQITDEHVRAAADGLSRRAYHVALVRRGSGATLLDELRSAAAAALGVHASSLGDSVTEILHECSAKAGEQAFIILFDTALGRDTRVARDDGPLLSEVAEVGISMGIFVGVALDDDISGADGPNASISRSFVIDYLDQEHLFKIVDTYIFSKDGKQMPLLRDIYEYYRKALPGFRWSEQRFLSLYPMHPATLEVAPLIRLYIQDFALLGFAAEAGVKILGRPANSLIGLDEMFDSVEQKLRGVAELRDAFVTFDRLDHDVIAKAPVATRLHAKLILKGLFLLSLDGQGASADDIAAGMMIFSEGASKIDVPGLLQSFVKAMPGAIAEAEGKFRLGEGISNDKTSVLDEVAASVSDDDVWSVLLQQAAEKFSDMETAENFGSIPTHCAVEWRGAVRRGEIVWRHESFAASASVDWTIVVERRGDARLAETQQTSEPLVLWRVAVLTEQEKATLRRFHVLRTQAAVREALGDSLATSMQIHSIAAERAWHRVFLQDARLTWGQEEYGVYDETTGAHTLAQVLSKALTPYFETLYPQHPEFVGSLGLKQSSILVANFFGGGAPDAVETVRLAEMFALPLGLASVSPDSIVPTPADELMQLQIITTALGAAAGADHLRLTDISARLAGSPLGLTREAQHLVLAAIVGQGQFDFVTATGNRVNHRSLDLQIIWDDIEGIATHKSEEYASGRLLSWAKTLTGDDALKSVDAAEDREQIVESLKEWLAAWTADNTLTKFDALPDEQLNTAVWRIAVGLKRTFGAAADSIDSLVRGGMSLVDCLKAVAELFSDSQAGYEQKIEELAVLNKYVLVSGRRGGMLTFVSIADWTGVAEVDDLRRELLSLLTGGGVGLNGKNDHIESLWAQFREGYATHYAERHAEVAAIYIDGEVLTGLMKSEVWSSFIGIHGLPLIDPQTTLKVETLVRRLRGAVCTADPAMELVERPVCNCGSGLVDLAAIEALPMALSKVLEMAMAQFRAGILNRKDAIIGRGKEVAPGSNIEFLVDSFASCKGFPRLTATELRLLREACQGLSDRSNEDEIEQMFAADAARWIESGSPETEASAVER
jgi:hypothetical protein